MVLRKRSTATFSGGYMSRGEAEGAGMWWVGAQSLPAKDLSDLTPEGVIIRWPWQLVPRGRCWLKSCEVAILSPFDR